MESIWIGGSPSRLGGADTELFHNIKLWREFNIPVNIVPMPGKDEKVQRQMEEIGCVYHKYKSDIFKDKIVVSYCNGVFLRELPRIFIKGRPKKVVWFNCMTYLFDAEIDRHRQGMIDLHGYVSDYQKSLIKSQLKEKTGIEVIEFEGYKPFYEYVDSEFNPYRDESRFVIGRVSRADPNKFAKDTWKIFDDVKTVKPKKIRILGWSGVVEKKSIGPKPTHIDADLLEVNSVPVKEFYHSLDCIIHKTGGSRESYCRIVPEAYAHGVPIIVEDDYAFPQLVINGQTGFRCKTSEEMSEVASMLSADYNRRQEIKYNAWAFLKSNISKPVECIKPWFKLLEG